MTDLDLKALLPDAGHLPEARAFETFHPFLKGVFSQWHVSPFEIGGLQFSCAEQWMMYAKAVLFSDFVRAQAIREADDPAQQKRLGAEVEDFDQAIWDNHKIAIVQLGSHAKFSQNPGARRQLAGTTPALLVEANPRDWIWGCGLSANDPGIMDPSQWRGENLLGRILTQVRQDLT